MRRGAPKVEAAKLHFPKFDQKQQRVIYQYLDGSGMFGQDDKSIWHKGWEPFLDSARTAIVDAIRERYTKAPLAPPSWAEVMSVLQIPAKEQGEYMQWLLKSGELIRVSDDMLYIRGALEDAESLLRKNMPDGFTLAQARDLLGLSRKEAQCICDHFDSIKLTYRDGEKRFWKNKNAV